METLNVDLGERSYPIFIRPGLLKEADRLRPYLGQGRAVIISNDTVAPLYLDQLKQPWATAMAGKSFCRTVRPIKLLALSLKFMTGC